ncbi:FtsX-like permease family protein [Verrucosispora sioxanthis]|uniref:FtsX-like permease family protein n=1 Tax=Verrucosispora sioxanthis TaxID=2499994 RepID=UPI002E2CE0F1|nr:FtsX-like permease family protein [Verrucosispora sioxanthis]
MAAAEGRADLSTLAAVGAGPGVRRLLSLCQAGVIAVLGSALGIVAGLASALIVLAFTNQRYADRWPIEPPYPLVMPWLTLGVLVVVPLVAMLGAALLTRSRLPVERRLD